MPTVTMKSDAQIKSDVISELKWDSRVNETEVGVQVRDGIVTLVGTVDVYAKKIAAREAAHRVMGVLDVVDEMQVKVAGIGARTDTEIARAVREALEWDAFVPDKDIRSTVSMISCGSFVLRQMGKASTPANSLNSIALPSMTGIAASGPMSPSPRTAVPSLTTATVLRLIVYWKARSRSSAIALQTRATPGV